MKTIIRVVTLGLCSWLAAAPAFAQLARLGETFSVWTDVSRGSAVGYDTRNNVFLVVSAHGRVNGRFVSADGAILGDPFVLQAVVSFGQFPQLAYSPDADGGRGAFLVTWHESDGPAPSLHSRLVSYTGGFLTPDRTIVGNDTYHEIMGAPVAYSTVSHEFLVAWRQYSDTNVFGLRLTLDGAPVPGSGVIPVATSTLFESDPSLTYNAANDEFFVVYRQGFGPTSVLGQRIKAGTGALVGGPSLLAQAATVNTTGVTYNPSTGQYLAAWHQMPGDYIAGRIVAADGTALGNVVALSTRVGTYDSLSVDVNEISGTVLLVGHDKLSVEIGGVEITGGGAPLTGGGPISAAGGSGNHVPRVSSNPTRREWLVVAARNFAQTVAQRISTSTPGGGGLPPAPPPPPPPPPAANCSIALNDNSAGIGGAAFTGSLTITTAAGCDWSATTQSSWLGVSNASASGPGTIQWTAQANTTGAPRTGTILIAGATASRTLTVTQAAVAARRGDFNADSYVDLIWQNQSNGHLALWKMIGFNLISGDPLNPGVVADTGWKIVAAVDIDNDGTTDLLWQHDTGYLSVWRMRGDTMVSGELLTPTPLSDTRWRVVGAGDIDRDGSADILWQHQDGRVSVWYMRGTTYLSGEVIAQSLSDQAWRVVGLADMNGDGHLDLMWHHSTSGAVAVWLMNRMRLSDARLLNDSAPDTNWHLRGLGDFDGDGDVDVLWQNDATGGLAAWVMNGLAVQNGLMLNMSVPDTNWKIVAPR